MSGPKAIAVMPAIGLPAVPVLAVGGAVVISAILISGVVSQNFSMNLKKKIKARTKDKISDAEAFLDDLKRRGFENTNQFACAVENLRLLTDKYRKIEEQAFESQDTSCLTNLLNEIDNINELVSREKQSFISGIFGVRSEILQKKAEIENKKNILLSDDFYLKLGIKPEHFKKLQEVAKNLIARTIIPEIPEFNVENIKAEALNSVKFLLSEADARLLAVMEKMRRQAAEFDEQSARDVISHIKTSPLKTVEDIVKEKSLAIKPDSKEISTLKKLADLMSEVAFLKKFDEYSTLEKKYDAVRFEENRSKRAMLYDDLVLYCDNLIKLERKNQVLIRDAASIKIQLQCFNTKNALNLIPEIDKFIEKPDGKKFEILKTLAAEALKKDIENENHKSCGQSIKEAFHELGYETSEDFETILIQNQKAQIKKPSMKNYHVEVVSNSSNSLLQVEVVREVENEKEFSESSPSQNIRDVEVEREFCGDYYKLIEKLEKDGIAINEKMHKKPGEVKVKKVINRDIHKKRDNQNERINKKERK